MQTIVETCMEYWP